MAKLHEDKGNRTHEPGFIVLSDSIAKASGHSYCGKRLYCQRDLTLDAARGVEEHRNQRGKGHEEVLNKLNGTEMPLE